MYGKEQQYTVNKTLNDPQKLSGRFDKKKPRSSGI
jgi:hypothetical protein